MKRIFLLTIFIICNVLSSQNINYDQDTLSEIVISGQSIFPSDKKFLENSGATLYIDNKELQKFEHTNINRVLEGQSGVHLYEEDGYGLRPNISIRGSLAERSSKINLMEDGVLIAPAPYSASAAYYFPNIARMKGVEILKGSGQIKYGPNTVGGSLNMISANAPNRFHTTVDLSFGNYNTKEALAYIGNKTGKFAYMLQYLHQDSDGFKKLASGNSTGFQKDEVLGKIVFDDKIGEMPFKVQLKYQYSEEDSHETYLGLVDEDFALHPFERYVGSDLDEMKYDHDQWVLSAELDIKPNLNVSLDAYRNSFHRNWFKTQSVDSGNGKVDLGKIFGEPDEYGSELNVLRGNYGGDNRLYLRNNNRKYLSKGIQANLGYKFGNDNVKQELHSGLRFHYDEADRFQWEDTYQLVGNTLGLVSQGTPGSQSNLIDKANAFSIFAQYQLQYQKWNFTLGLRYEDIKLERDNYKEDLNRVDAPVEQRENKNKVWIPGFAAVYQWNEYWSNYVGIHKGFSPAGNNPNQNQEESWNYELGLRHKKNHLKAEITAYIADYKNLLGSDLNASGGAGNNELYNAGAVVINGFEGQIQYGWEANPSLKVPFNFTYTYQDSSFKKEYDSEVYGLVQKGDQLPYIPKNQLRAQIGLEWQKGVNFYISYRYIGKRSIVADKHETNPQNLIPAYGLVDISLQYQMNKNWKFYLTADNLFDKTYAVARAPYGLRAGMPFFVKSGIQVKL